MYNRLLKKPLQNNKSFFLFGPRGVGKTTWIRSCLTQTLYFDLLETRLYTKLLSDPQSLEKLIPLGFADWIVIDEVQRIPMLLNEVHRLIENKKYKFILTGSSARNLRKKGVNLLAGRALTYHLYPLTAQELGKDYDLGKVLQFGTLAAVFSEPDPQKYLESYVHTYLREEVLQEGLTRNISDFARFLEIASYSQASQLNMNNIAREAEIHQKVVTSYFNILEDLLLSFRLYPFTKKAKRRLVTHPKFYYFDVGVYRHLRRLGPFDHPEEISGIALESLFLQELRAINDYYECGYQIYFWRSQSGLEINFVLYGAKGLLAFEIKQARKVNEYDLKNLRKFKEDYPMTKLYLLYGGERKEYHNDIEIIPFFMAMQNLPQLLS